MFRFRFFIVVACAGLGLGLISAPAMQGTGVSKITPRVAVTERESRGDDVASAARTTKVPSTQVQEKQAPIVPTCKAAGAQEDASEKSAEQNEDASEKKTTSDKASAHKEDKSEKSAERAEDQYERATFKACIGTPAD